MALLRATWDPLPYPPRDFLLSVLYPQPKPGVINFIRCINLVSRAQEGSINCRQFVGAELGPGGALQEPPILQQVGEASIDHLLLLTEETPVRIGHYVLDGKELGLSAG